MKYLYAFLAWVTLCAAVLSYSGTKEEQSADSLQACREEEPK